MSVASSEAKLAIKSGILTGIGAFTIGAGALCLTPVIQRLGGVPALFKAPFAPIQSLKTVGKVLPLTLCGTSAVIAGIWLAKEHARPTYYHSREAWRAWGHN